MMLLTWRRKLNHARSAAFRLRVALACVGALALVLTGACHDPNAPVEIGGNTSINSGNTSSLPRTSLPMPPAVAPERMAQASAEQGFTLLDGRRARLADYRGNALVLDFYATYCPPCRDEIPHLSALQRRFEREGLRVVGLNVGGDEDRRLVPQFIRELNIDYTLGNPDQTLVDVFLADSTAIPQTFVFDRQGRLVRRFVGYDPTMASALEEAVRAALANGQG